jgi:hypothetical protein
VGDNNGSTKTIVVEIWKSLYTILQDSWVAGNVAMAKVNIGTNAIVV